ncbi:MAG TPA: hypothetical protein VFD32_08035 [Dehalococcoidia bacterium]|nr:hypothetical protein [Dehalococcoidia bacterium]
MAPAVAALDDPARNALATVVSTSLAAYLDDGGMAAPWEAHVLTADA